jgi:segregation and condensation protein A
VPRRTASWPGRCCRGDGRRRPGRRHGSGPRSAFLVHLDQFDGPFDLLLGLIAKHQLDVTELALSQVTDDFIAHLKAAGSGWDLDQTTEFLVVAATLLDLKAARLLPSAEVEDEEDLALLEARDLLFARLLQYRAYKQAAAVFAARMREEALRHPRAAVLEERFAGLLPEVLLGFGTARVRRLRRPDAGAEDGAGGVDRPHPRPAGQRAGPGRADAARG